MKEWWLTKTQREQLMLIAAAAVTLLFLLYLLAWQPFTQAVEKKRQLVASQRTTLNWMEENLPEIQRLRGQHGRETKTSNEALLTLVDRTAKQRQLRQQIKRIKPQGDDAVQLWVEQVSFDTLLRWLGELTAQHGIAIDSLNIDRQEAPGLVNARLVLQRGGGA
jgi:general secretion pathway protein M